MLYEAPLVAFTVLAQTAVGAHLAINLYEKLAKPIRLVEPRMNIARFAILFIMGLGFVFSTMHLGSPLRAFNALNRVGSAALSNEILTGASFLSFAGLYWLLTITHTGRLAIRRALNWVSIVIGIVFMFAMANVYYIQTVPAWYSPMTVIAFWFTVVTLGLLFAHTLLTVLDVASDTASRCMMWTGVTLIALNLAFVALQTIYFAGISTAIHSGLAQISLLSDYVAGHVILMVVAAGLWLYSELFSMQGCAKKRLVIAACITLFIAEILGRNVFYGMHFTSGLY